MAEAGNRSGNVHRLMFVAAEAQVSEFSVMDGVLRAASSEYLICESVCTSSKSQWTLTSVSPRLTVMDH